MSYSTILGFLRAAQDAVEAGGAAADLFAPWEGESLRRILEDAVPLRFLGAFHDLALSGEAPALSVHYPTPETAGDPVAAWSAAEALLGPQADHIAGFMGHEPQTNEVGRSALLLLGFMAVGRRFRLPLSLVELGASAGLNANWHRFGYRLGDTRWGDPASPLQLSPEWRAERSPRPASLTVAARCACDRKPLDVADPLVRRRLQAYCWPDQQPRLARLQAAIGLALDGGVKVETADAADFVRERAAPRPGVATVVYHSVFWMYVPPDGQAAIRAGIEAHGAAATEDAPLAWVRMENAGSLTELETAVTLWPGGQETLLAVSHPHGTWVEYRG